MSVKFKNKITLFDALYWETYGNYPTDYKDKTIYDICHNKGIFSTLRTLFNDVATIRTKYPLLYSLLTTNSWGGNQHMDADYFDIDYMGKSGQKWISNVIKSFAFTFNQESFISFSNYEERLGRTIIQRFAEKWEKLLYAFSIEYNPIHNYDMEENEKVATDFEVKDNTDNFATGFNSNDSVPTTNDKNTITSKGDWDKNKRNLTRSGNIGVTTSQQMLQSEIDLRKYNLIEQIYRDLDSLLTLSIY